MHGKRRHPSPSPDNRPHVVIIGAGFAGLNAAKALGKASTKVAISVIDRNNYHLFQPLLYQVATAGLSPADIATPVRGILRKAENLEVLMANVEGIDVSTRTLQLDGGEKMSYDYLLLTTGARHSYFAHPEWEALAPGLKTVDDATEIRRRVLLAFEKAERCTDAKEREELMTFVIVGGGPTGIELAGAISELARYALARDFDHIKPELTKIILVEAGPRLLAQFHPDTSASALKSLEHLGVQVMLNKRVMQITAATVELEGQTLRTQTTIWAAGVAPSPLAKQLGAPLDKSGRVLVNPDLSVPGHPEIFVAGDLAAVKWGDKGFVPGMAPGAMQGGRHAAANILHLIRKQPTAPFHYFHKGSMATIGRAAAVVDMDHLRFSGVFAWLTWLLVHIMYLIGFRNRLLVLIEWGWSYLTYQRGTRLITGAKKAANFTTQKDGI